MMIRDYRASRGNRFVSVKHSQEPVHLHRQHSTEVQLRKEEGGRQTKPIEEYRRTKTDKKRHTREEN